MYINWEYLNDQRTCTCIFKSKFKVWSQQGLVHWIIVNNYIVRPHFEGTTRLFVWKLVVYSCANNRTSITLSLLIASFRVLNRNVMIFGNAIRERLFNLNIAEKYFSLVAKASRKNSLEGDFQVIMTWGRTANIHSRVCRMLYVECRMSNVVPTSHTSCVQLLKYILQKILIIDRSS